MSISKESEKIIVDTSIQETLEYLEASYLTLLSDYVEISQLKKISFPETADTNDRINNITKKISGYIVELENSFNLAVENREDILSQITNCRDDVMNLFKSLSHVTRQAKVLQELTDIDYFYKAFLTEDQSDDMDEQLFFTHCLSFARMTQDDLQQKDNMSKILKCIPIQMTKEKFSDHIKESMMYLIDLLPQNDYIFSTFHFARVKMLPTGFKEYYENFTSVRNVLSEFEQTDFKILLPSDIEKINGTLIELLYKLDDLDDYIKLQYNCLNSLISILTFTADFDMLYDDMTKDIYYSICEIIKDETGEQMELVAETILSRLQFKIEKVLDQVELLENKSASFLKKVTQDDITEETLNIIGSKNLVKQLFLNPLDMRNLMPVENINLDEPINLNTEIEKITTAIKESLEKLPAYNQKLIRQVYLGVLPTAWTIDKFESNLVFSFQNIEKKHIKKASSALVAQLLIDEGVLQVEDVTDEHDHEGHPHHH